MRAATMAELPDAYTKYLEMHPGCALDTIDEWGAWDAYEPVYSGASRIGRVCVPKIDLDVLQGLSNLEAMDDRHHRIIERCQIAFRAAVLLDAQLSGLTPTTDYPIEPCKVEWYHNTKHKLRTEPDDASQPGYIAVRYCVVVSTAINGPEFVIGDITRRDMEAGGWLAADKPRIHSKPFEILRWVGETTAYTDPIGGPGFRAVLNDCNLLPVQGR